jgi:hypothetical protein
MPVLNNVPRITGDLTMVKQQVVRITAPTEQFDLETALHGKSARLLSGDPTGIGLVAVLKGIPATHRKAAFQAAIREIDEAERRASLEQALRDKVEAMSSDEFERFIEGVA